MAATSAFAQSSVTLYGIAEAAYGTSNTTGYDATPASNVKTAGLANGTGNGRWGIKGTEDVGNGLKANFVAEAQLLIADGTTFDQTVKNQVANSQQTNVFGAKTRQTLVGLEQAGYGALNLGYKKGVEQDHNDTFNLGFQEGAAGNEYHTASRLGRAKGIWYTSPAFGGVTVNVQHSSGSAEYSDAAKQGTDQIDVAITGLSALYVNGPLTAGVSYTSGSVDLGSSTTAGSNPLDSTNTGTQFSRGTNDYKALGYGAKYNLGVATVAAQGGKREYGLTTAANLKETKWSQLGVNVPMGKAELIAVYGKATNYGTDAAESSNVKGHQMGAKYNFSKRTIGYVYTGKSKTENATTTDDFKVKTVNVGMMHSF